MLIKISCHTAVKQLQMIKEELVLLDYRDKLKKDEKFKKEEDIKNSKPIPKLEWYTIPKSGKVD